ncbi:MAG: SDR family oxidoreductase [SAR324 cluster bacterium]|nr:SDR family oxidoreductase [SAR324 cluster bacterium]
MSSNNSFKVAIITGAGTGVGRSVAERFLTEGYRVALLGRRQELLDETAAGSENALVLPCDVSQPEAVENAFTDVVKKWGRIDVLFNNAGMGMIGRTIDETPIEDWLKVVDVNLTGSFLCARAAFSQMRRQNPQGGRIINNGSVSAQVPRPGSAPYTATKHGLTGLTRSLSLDGRPFNIACGQVDIGNAATPMTDRMATGVPQADGSIRIEPRMDVENVATTVLYMAELPLEANVQFVTVMATTMPFIGRG